MLPHPLHPAVVHFPLVLAFLLPISAGVALWAIHRGSAFRRSWTLPLLFAAALAGSAWVALQTGRGDEDRVEDIVGRAPIHEHEEAAELFLVLAGTLALVTAAGLLGGTAGRAARIVATAGSLAVVVAAVRVGAEGGALVYERGAAQAYVAPSAGPTIGAAGEAREDERREGEREHR